MSNVILRKQTADNKTVLVYADGDLSGYPCYFRGAKVQKNMSLSLMIAEEACLFDASEMGCLIKAANMLAKKGPVLPGDLRSLASRLASKRKI